MILAATLEIEAAPEKLRPSKVHVVFMTHLDVGFTDTSRNVCDRYFDLYIPQAMNLSATLRAACAQQGCPAYRWTQFPWLVSEFIDGLAGCAHRPRTPAEVAALERGIARDDVVWHANSLNLLTELVDGGLWDFGLKMRNKLNTRYGKRHGRVAGKLSDVTGMSRSAVPWLARNGVRAMHIGYNGVGGLPLVVNDTAYERGTSFCGRDRGCPAEAVFKWTEPSTGEHIVAMIESSYGEEIDVPGHARVTAVHSKAAPDHVLVFHYTVDNRGVPTASEVVSFWQQLQKRFPGAAVTLSTLDDFAEEAFAGELQPTAGGAVRPPSRLPSTSAELGDSWLYGGAADPWKLASFREARRALDEAVAAGEIDTSWSQYESYMRRLLKGPGEHNWGLSTGSACKDCRVSDAGQPFGSTWPNAAFAKARRSAELQRYDCPAGFSPGSARWGSQVGVCGYGPIEQEWAEQREWMHPLPSWSALRGWTRVDLENEEAWSDFAHRLEKRLGRLRTPRAPDAAGMPSMALPLAPTRCGDVVVGISSAGVLDHLLEPSGRQWADANHTLGRFRYVTYSQSDFDEFQREWNNHADDFGKPGMQSASPESKTWEPVVRASWGRIQPSGCRFVVELEMPEESKTKYGAPGSVHVTFDAPGANGNLVDLTLVWRNKTATRLAESMWLSFIPLATSTSARWQLDVLGYPVDPLDVVERGTRYLHSVWDGAELQDGTDAFRIRTLDTALVAPGGIHNLLRYSENGTQPDPVGRGMHANLHNNLWGTAFPQWYDDDGIARFQLMRGSAVRPASSSRDGVFLQQWI